MDQNNRPNSLLQFASEGCLLLFCTWIEGMMLQDWAGTGIAVLYIRDGQGSSLEKSTFCFAKSPGTTIWNQSQNDSLCDGARCKIDGSRCYNPLYPMNPTLEYLPVQMQTCIIASASPTLSSVLAPPSHFFKGKSYHAGNFWRSPNGAGNSHPGKWKPNEYTSLLPHKLNCIPWSLSLAT